MTWKRNSGKCPKEAAGKRVKVRLFNGQVHGAKPVSPTTPAGWAADDKGKCNWGISNPPHPFEIEEYEIL